MNINLVLLIFLCIACSNSKTNDDLDFDKGMFFFSSNEKGYLFFEIEDDQLNLYNIYDSISIKKVASINDITLDENRELTLKIKDYNYKLTQFSLNKTQDFELIYDGFWYRENKKIKEWRKIIPKHNTSRYISEDFEKNINRTFFTSYSDTFFDLFCLIRIHGNDQKMFLVTSVTKNKVLCYNLWTKKIETFTIIPDENISLTGDWQLCYEKQIPENMFTRFTINKNEGVLTNGFYKGSTFYVFKDIKKNSFYFVIRNDELIDDIIEFEYNGDNPRIIFTDDIISKTNIKFEKRD